MPRACLVARPRQSGDAMYEELPCTSDRSRVCLRNSHVQEWSPVQEKSPARSGKHMQMQIQSSFYCSGRLTAGSVLTQTSW